MIVKLTVSLVRYYQIGKSVDLAFNGNVTSYGHNYDFLDTQDNLKVIINLFTETRC